MAKLFFKTNSLKKQNALTFLLFTVTAIPFFKLITATANITIPIYYVPTIIMTFYVLLNQKHYLKKNWILLNLFLFSYIVLSFAKDPIINSSRLKMYMAALAYTNTGYCLFSFFKSKDYSCSETDYYSSSLNLSLAFMGICFFAFIGNSLLFPFELNRDNLLPFLAFDRDTSDLRANFILRYNPVGFFQHNFKSIRYIGQQLLILPVVTLPFVFSLNQKSTTKTKAFYFTILFLSAFIVNSRAIILAVIAVPLIYYFRSLPRFLHYLFCILTIALPYSISFLNRDFASNRQCQLTFVTEHLSLFGNGIGSYINDLNKLCGSIQEGIIYKNIVTTSYDNIHIEFIHYFGLIPYAIAMTLLAGSILKNNTPHSRMLIFFVSAFLSLNFNLFELLVLPLLILLWLKSSTQNN